MFYLSCQTSEVYLNLGCLARLVVENRLILQRHMINLERWKLILGPSSDKADPFQLSTEQEEVDELLNAIYGDKDKPGFGKSTNKIKRWLDGIRLQFPTEVVQIMQADALERQGVKEMLLEPELLERIEPSVNLVATILQLQHLIPEKTKSVARNLVQKLVNEIEKKLKPKIQFAVQTATKQHSKPTSPSNANIDWKKTIYQNLKNYRPEIPAIIPDRWFGFKRGYKLPQIIILVDKSESMINSMIYASIISSVLASMKSVRTHLIFFDTEVTDLTDKYMDPVDILFSVPCGGGTDIAVAMKYAHQQIQNQNQCLLFLISDLYEYGNKNELLSYCKKIKDKQVQLISLLSLNDEGIPDYDIQIAKSFMALDIPCFACNPDRFPELISEYLTADHLPGRQAGGRR